MDAGIWARLKTAFAELADLPADERTRRLDRIASVDPGIADRLRALLAMDARPADHLAPLDPQPLPADAGSGHTPDPFGLAGRTVGRFRVIDVLGAGGMGVAYRAEDTRLGRRVALKFLLPQFSFDAEFKERFLHEARAASALDHANVCTVHEAAESELGQLFIVMPLYEGETLKTRLAREGALAVDASVDIARQVLRGLAAAHAAGITHRDLKPANLLVTPDGTVKILDFGLARVKDVHLTRPGMRAGTVAWMSPEQLAGEDPDTRADLWALGVVLYEMLTGTHAFGSGHDLSTCYRILHEQPAAPSSVRPDVPPALDAIVAALLEKQPEARPATAHDVIALLDGTSPARARNRLHIAAMAAIASVLAMLLVLPLVRGTATEDNGSGPAQAVEPGSIAVLPFLDTGSDAEPGYFADGFTEEILNALAQLPELRVTARTSSFMFRDRDASVREIARQLGVAAVLEGSVHRAGGRLRVTTRLIDGASERHVWSQTFDRSAADIFDVQSEIARTVANALQVRLGPGREPAPPPTRELAAHEAYLRGLFHWNRRTIQDLRQAITHFEQAILLDSSYARPYAGLALALVVLHVLPASGSDDDRLPRVHRMAARALALDPYLAEAHAARGYAFHWQFRWDDAQQEFERALALRPTYATAHQWYGEHLAKMGQGDEGEAAMRRAIALDPLSLVAHNDLGILFMLSGRYEEARAQLERVHGMDPAFPLPLFLLHRVHLLAGQADAGADAGRRWAEMTGIADPADMVTLAHATRDPGMRPAAFRVLARWETDTAPRWPDIAMYYVLLGEHERAITALQRAFDARSPILSQIRVAPWIEPLRSDPRVVEIVRRMGFP